MCDDILLDLFCTWYGYSIKSINDIRRNRYNNFTNSEIEYQWKKLWFAKNNEQIKVDEELQKYKNVIDDYILYEPTSYLFVIQNQLQITIF